MLRPLFPRPRAFTLVEMLVVIGIISILAALLLPAVMSAITRARNAVIAMEISQISTAVEAYRLEKGDYPPNFRSPDVVRRHIMKCYPRIDQGYFIAFMSQVFPPNGSTIPTPPSAGVGGTINIDEAESLVFWLSMTDKNPQYPFLSLKLANYPGTLPAPDPKKFYDFDQTRLAPTVNTDVPSFLAKYCKDTFYIYIDSRSYDSPITDPWDVCRFQSNDGPPGDTYAYADDTQTGVRPYWYDATAGNKKTNVPAAAVLVRDNFKPMNPTTFQIICAGQDGDFGYAATDKDVKTFPSGGGNGGQGYNDGDKDNITNFSGGRTLRDAVP